MTVASISKLPLGILGFLGIKNGGAYPRTLGDAYAPTLDLLNMLAGVHAEEVHVANAALPAAGATGSFSTPMVVPFDQVWLLIAGGIRITTGVGEAWSGIIGTRQFATPSPNNVVPISDTIASIAASSFVHLRAAALPMWLTPGFEVCVQTNTLTGAPVARPAFRLARFQV